MFGGGGVVVATPRSIASFGPTSRSNDIDKATLKYSSNNKHPNMSTMAAPSSSSASSASSPRNSHDSMVSDRRGRDRHVELEPIDRAHASSSSLATSKPISAASAVSHPSSASPPLPRLPSISSLLAGLQSGDASSTTALAMDQVVPPRRVSTTQISDERSTYTPSNADNATFGSTPRSSAQSFAGWDHPSPFSNSQSASPLLASAPLFSRSMKLTPLALASSSASASTAAPVLAPAQAQLPGNASPRHSIGQLTSPSGGPLHPLPSGLVGFAPLSPSQSERAPPAAFRPRSNSLSMHPYANPFHHRASTYEHDPRRRGSMTDGIARPSSSGGWAQTITADAPFHSQALAAARARKQAQDQGWAIDRSALSSSPSHSMMQRPRAASISTADDARPTMSWADSEHDIAMRKARLAGGRINSLASSSSSPRQGSDIDIRTEAMEHLEIARERALAGMDSREPVSMILATSPSPDARIALEHEYTRQHGRLSLGGAPDVTGLHITPAERRSSLNAPPFYHSFTGGSAVQHHSQPITVPRGAEYQNWARTSPNLPGTGSFPSQPHLPSAVVDDGSLEANEVGRYGCPHCPKRFARPSSLRTHIHSHTGEKPFSCDMCGRGFSVQSNLRRHRKIHRTSGLAQSSSGGGEDRNLGSDEEGGGSHSDENSDEHENARMEEAIS